MTTPISEQMGQFHGLIIIEQLSCSFYSNLLKVKVMLIIINIVMQVVLLDIFLLMPQANIYHWNLNMFYNI